MNLLGKPPKVTDEPIAKIISNQQDIKLGQFTQESDLVQRKIENGKAAGFDEIHSKVWKTKKFDDILLYSHNDINNNNNNTNTGGTNEFIFFYLQFLATRGERHKS